MAEIAFESPQEIAEKLSRYEDLFKYRYTEKEEGYRKATQRSSRWYQVPAMSPWPPRRPFGSRRRYQDWDSSHRYGYRSRERGWRPYYSRPRYYEERDRGYHRRHRSRSPYDRRSPRNTDMARDRERSRSPYSPGRYHYQHRGYHRSPSPPPLPQYPPPPHHDYAQRSRSRSPHWERSPRRDRPSPVRREASPPGRRELSPLARREVSPAGRREPPSPVRRDQEEEGYTTDEKLPEEGREPEKSEPPQTNPLVELGFGADAEKKVVPSVSDVLDILSSAHVGANEITSQNLKKVQKGGQGLAARKEKGRGKMAVTTATGKGQSTQERESLGHRGGGLAVPSLNASSNLLISHGTTENVPTSLFDREQTAEAPPVVQHSDKSQKHKKTKKRPKVVVSDDESIDVVRAERLTWDPSGNTSAVVPGAVSNIYGETESLILHVDKKFCSQVSHQAADATVLDAGTVFLDVGGTHDTSSHQYTGTSLDTTATSLDTTGTSLDTTATSLDTTGTSLATAGRFLDTTGTSLATTGRLLDTTGTSLATTGRFLDTTGTSLATTGRLLDTTGTSLATTGRFLDTTGTMLTATCNDPTSGKLVIKSQGHSRSSSPANIEGEIAKKSKKKKKKKSKHVTEGTGLRLKITIGRSSDTL